MSRRSSTSEALGRLGGYLRLTHPFPSILDGLVVAASSVLVGGSLLTATRLGLAMTALQAGIGILNDLVDAPRDAGRIPPKPIPAGVISGRGARIALVTAAAIGLTMSATLGPAVFGLAVVVLAIGFGYDLLAKGTAWSWLPFAIGIPILPVFGWIGTVSTIPDRMGVVIAAAVVAGGAVAVANARADIERDLAAGTGSVATVLGLERSWWVATALFGLAASIAVVAVIADPRTAAAGAGGGIMVVGAALIVAGAALGRRGDPGRRERAWELQAVGLASLATGYLAMVASAP